MFDSTKCYLIMQNTPKAQDAAYMIVNHRRKHKIIEAYNIIVSISLHIFCVYCKTSFKAKWSYFNNLVKRT